MNGFSYFRKKQNLTQQQVADMMGLDQTTISKWENRVGGCPLVGQPTSHSTVRTVRYTALPKFTRYFAE